MSDEELSIEEVVANIAAGKYDIQGYLDRFAAPAAGTRTRVLVLESDRPTITPAILDRLKEENIEVLVAKDETFQASLPVSITFPDFVHQPNRKERRADAARARKRR